MTFFGAGIKPNLDNTHKETRRNISSQINENGQ